MSSASVPVLFKVGSSPPTGGHVLQDETVRALKARLGAAAIILNGQRLDDSIRMDTLGLTSSSVITYVPLADVSSSSIPSLGERLMVPFKYNGRLVDVEWYMDQPYSDVAASLGDLRPVVHGRNIDDTETPRSLRLDFESVVQLLPFGLGSRSGGSGRSVSGSSAVVSVPASPAPAVISSSDARASVEEVAVATAAPTSSSRSGGDLRISLKFPDGSAEAATWSCRMRVASFKAVVISEFTGFPARLIGLNLGGTKLADTEFPLDAGVGNGSEVSVVFYPPTTEHLPAEKVMLTFRLLNSSFINVECGFYSPIRDIKPLLESKAGIISSRQRLVYRGTTVEDSDTPAGLGMQLESVVHVVRLAIDMSEVYTAERLKANCKFCGTPGAQYDIRAVCHNCKSEAVNITQGRILKGVDKWSDLAHIKVACFVCHQHRLDDGEDLLAIHELADIGFLCTEVPGGSVCPARKVYRPDPADPLKTQRMQCLAAGDADETVFAQNIKRELGKLFSYAHTSGVEDRVRSATSRSK